MSPDFNHLQCVKNDRLGVSALHPLVLCCLWRRDVCPWEEMTICTYSGGDCKWVANCTLWRSLAMKLRAFPALFPLHFSLLLLFSLSCFSLYLFFRLCLLKAYSPNALGTCFAEQRSRAGFWAEPMKEHQPLAALTCPSLQQHHFAETPTKFPPKLSVINVRTEC